MPHSSFTAVQQSIDIHETSKREINIINKHTQNRPVQWQNESYEKKSLKSKNCNFIFIYLHNVYQTCKFYIKQVLSRQIQSLSQLLS